tara:strand:+ start:8089 stop:8355 length:267 start_codon:yes stop_codon:yes gene_type:complete
MKTLMYFATHNNKGKAILARAALCLEEEDRMYAQNLLNKTAFSCRDIIYWHNILRDLENSYSLKYEVLLDNNKWEDNIFMLSDDYLTS